MNSGFSTGLQSLDHVTYKLRKKQTGWEDNYNTVTECLILVLVDIIYISIWLSTCDIQNKIKSLQKKSPWWCIEKHKKLFIPKGRNGLKICIIPSFHLRLLQVTTWDEMLKMSLTCLQLGIDVVGLVWGLHTASLVVLFTDEERQQRAVLVLSVIDGTRREPSQLTVL